MSNEPIDGLQIFDSVLKKKQTELNINTEIKTSELGLDYTPVNLELSYDPVDLDSVIENTPSIQKYKASPKSQYFLDDYEVQSGIGYLANTAGSFIAGGGSLLDSVLSAPNVIADSIGTPSYNALDYLDILGDKAESFTSKFHNPVLVQKFHEDATHAFRDNSGAVDVLIGLGQSIASNPAALPQVFGQSFATMALLAKGGSATAVVFSGVFGDRVQEAINTYKLTHGGRSPQGEDLRNIMIGAGVSATVETIESKFLLNKSSSIAKAVTDKRSLLGTVGKVGKDVLSGASAEAGQEFSAQYITELTGRADTVDSLLSNKLIEPSAVNATIGAGVGGGIKTVTGATSLSGKTVAEGIDKTVSFVDKKVETNTEKRIENALSEDDYISAAEVLLEKDTTRFKTLDEHKEHLIKVYDLAEQFDSQLDAVENTGDTDKFNTLNTKVANINKRLDIAKDVFIEAKSKNEQGLTPQQAEEVINTTEDVSEDITKSAVNTLATAIAQAGEVSDKTVKSLKGSIFFNELDSNTKDIVNKYEEARSKPSGYEKVSNDIIEGNKVEGFAGIKDYSNRISSAIQTSNLSKATKVLQSLVKFRDHQVNKLNNPPKGYSQHNKEFEQQLRSEITTLDQNIKLFDTQVNSALGKSPLSSIEYTPFKGTSNETKVAPKQSVNIEEKVSKTADKKVKKEVVSKPKENITEAKVKVLSKTNKISNKQIREKANSTLEKATTLKRVKEIENSVDKVLERQVKNKKEKEKPKHVVEDKSETAPKEAVKSEIVKDLESTDTDVFIIPDKSLYSKDAKLKNKISYGGTTLRTTYLNNVLKHDSMLKSLKELIENCSE